jgi:hypothetical protein
MTMTSCLQLRRTDRATIYCCPPSVDKEGNVVNVAPIKGQKRHTSVPLPNPGGGTVNLTLVTSGDGVPRTFMNNNKPFFQGNQGTQAHGSDQHQSTLSYKDYPKISDFLISLDHNFDDPPRGFKRYTNLLTSESHLGFGRIHEIVDVISGTSILGGEWLKGEIGTSSS